MQLNTPEGPLDQQALAAALEHERIPITAELVGELHRVQEADGLSAELCRFAVMRVRQAVFTAAALRIAARQCKDAPEYFPHVSYATCLKEGGHPELSIGQFEAALKYRPDDRFVLADLGDLHLDLKQLDEAAHHYERILQQVPEDDWASVSLVYTRYLQGQPDALGELRRMMGHPTRGARAFALACRDGAFRIVADPPPGEVLDEARSLAQMRGRNVAQGLLGAGDLGGAEVALGLQINVAMPCAPSALRVLRLTEQAVRDAGTSISIAQLSVPIEARLLTPGAGVSAPLWRQGPDGLPEPALPPPTPELAEAVAEIAHAHFDIDRWAEQTTQLASRLSPEDLPHLMAVMAHTPQLPGTMPPWMWVFHVQLAAAMTLARLGQGALPGSTRRQALYDLIHGPVDWASTAALVAACDLAAREAAYVADIDALLRPLSDRSELPVERACLREPYQSCRRWFQDTPEPPASSSDHTSASRALIVAAEEALDAEDYPQMEIWLDLAAEIVPEHIDITIVWTNCGSRFFSDDQFASALRCFERATARLPILVPKMTWAWHWRAYTLARLERTDEVNDCVDRVDRELTPHWGALSAVQYYETAAMHVLANRVPRALEYLRCSIALEPERAAKALGDDDFEAIREDPDFVQLVSAEDG